MKTATIPSLRVDPALRQAAESLLEQGETLSAFVERAILRDIELRRVHQAFIARGMTARDEARTSGEYFSAEAVLAELDEMLAARV